MKLILLSFVLFSLVTRGFAQNRWSIQHGGKVLLNANKEDTTANEVKITSIKKGSLIVTFVPQDRGSVRKRRLMLSGAADEELYSKEALSIVIPASSLKKWRLTNNQLKVYTLPIPDEGGEMVRVRRVHLCTINFE